MGEAAVGGAELARDLGQASLAWLGLAHQRQSAQMAGWLALWRCRTPQDLIVAHADLLVEELDAWRRGLEALAGAVSMTAGDTARFIDTAS